jgi:diguanylate cyclase (GGDEF)-like protein/PAS domain S-box-containing protein
MSPDRNLLLADASKEVAALIATLHETGARLEELTSGEVDTVAGDDGRTFLLLRAQEQLRLIEEVRQTAILNALPAYIALLDGDGVIVSVNEAWQGFTCASAIQGPGHAPGTNYLQTCDGARGEGSPEAHRAAEGVRSVLGGWAASFTAEFPCHSATRQRWLLLTVTPLLAGRSSGAVVMQLDITEERQAKESLTASESRFRQMAENIRDVFFLQNLDGSKLYYVSPAYEEIWGRSCESLYANPGSSFDAIHPHDRDQVMAKIGGRGIAGFDFEFRILRPDGETRWIRTRGFPVLDGDGKPYRMAGLASDITARRQAAEELHRSESFKGAILESSLDCVVTIDHEGRIVEFNPAAVATFGHTREQVLGKAMVELIVPPRLREAHRAGFAHYLATGTGRILGRRLELEAIRADGTEFPIELAITSVGGTSTPMFTAFIRDITERRDAGRKIKRLNRVYAVLSGINTLIVRVRDRDELFREACRIAVEHGEFRIAWIGIVDRAAMKVVPIASAGVEAEFLTLIKDRYSLREDAPQQIPMSARAVREKKTAVSNEVLGDPKVLFAADLDRRGVASMAALPLMVGGEAVGVLALYSAELGFFDAEEMRLLEELAGDISFAIDHIDKQARFDYLAYYDSLTGLANRSLFLERVTQYMRSASSAGHKLAVLLVDLERFKNINDSLGQSAGDELLKQVADWLTRHAGDASLLARLDADHFAIVLPETKDAGDVGGRLDGIMVDFLEHPFHLNDAVFRIAAKAGVALFPDDGADAPTLFRHAEAALKKAKAGGDRYLFYTQKMTEMVAGKLTLENQLRHALERREFVLHYQPKVSLVTGKLTGAEALIRWNDPNSGLVPPGRFIPILEETGLIYEVGRWALQQALEDYLRWRASGHDLARIAVNVSPLQLRNRAFVAEIRQVVDIDPHAAAALELEITESVIMQDVKHNIASLHAIRAMGVTIAIDDFGTGFSSLSYLSKLPVDTLKIDRSFVVDMTAGPEGLALVSTIISLAHSLKLKVVAEGVETEEQSRLLRLLNCDETQGFLFSKPVPAQMFEERFLFALGPGDMKRLVHAN